MTELLPRWSTGIRSTSFADGALLHDTLRYEIHVLNPIGAVVWASCDGTTPLAELVDDFAEATGHPAPEIERDVRAHLDQLRAAGLVDRPPLPAPVSPPVDGPIDEPLVLRSLRVLDEAVEVRANEAGLLDRVRLVFRDLVATDRPVTTRVGLARLDDGQVRVHGRGYDRTVEGGEALDEALASWLNQVVAPSAAVLAFHAGAVRSPDGRVVLIPGTSGAGKSTLTAALVQAGWDYLTDEAAGIRCDSLGAVGYPKPLALDASSRSLLGLASGHGTVPVAEVRADATAVLGDAGPVHAVVFPAGVAGGGPSRRRLDPHEAVVAMAANAINLVPSGQLGLEALAGVATTVPCVQLGVRDLSAAVAEIRAFATIDGAMNGVHPR